MNLTFLLILKLLEFNMEKIQLNKVTLEHIALAAGVSKITVSRALSFSDKVKPETRDKIIQVAENLGYFPRRHISHINEKKLIGIINPNMSNPFFGQLAQIMTKISMDLDYDILMFDSYESREIEERSIQRLIEYNAKAVILSAISSDKDYNPNYLSLLEKLNIPVVLVDREINKGKHNGIYIDNTNCGEVAAEYINNCYKGEEIIVIAGPENSNVSIERVNGFMSKIRSKGDVRVFYTDFFIEEAYSSVKAILESGNSTYYFLGLNNQISLGILKACLEKGLTYGKEFKLFSIDELPYADNYGIKVPCISHNLYEIAYQAINLAVREISDRNKIISKIVIRSRLIDK